MYRRNKGSTILIIIIAIAALLLSVMGATFAYFTANIDYVDKPKEVVTKSQVLEIIFKQENQILYENLMPGRPGEESQAINENKNLVTFSVQSTDAVTLRTPYTVYFVITENTFGGSEKDEAYSNVVYLLNGKPGICPIKNKSQDLNSIIDNSCKDSNFNCGVGQYYDGFNSVLHTFKNENVPTKLGRIPTGALGRVKIGSGVVGAYGTKDNWTFELWVNEVGDEQNYDQGKFIKGYIEIDTDDTTIYTNEPSQFKTP